MLLNISERIEQVKSKIDSFPKRLKQFSDLISCHVRRELIGRPVCGPSLATSLVGCRSQCSMFMQTIRLGRLFQNWSCSHCLSYCSMFPWKCWISLLHGLLWPVFHFVATNYYKLVFTCLLRIYREWYNLPIKENGLFLWFISVCVFSPSI